MIEEKKEFYSPDEIAKRLNIHEQTVLGYIRDGKLPALQLEKGYRISEADFQRFVHGSRKIKTAEDIFLQLEYQSKYKIFRKTHIKPVEEITTPIPNSDLNTKLDAATVRSKQGFRAYPLPVLALANVRQEHLNEGLLLEKKISFAGDLFFFTFASIQGEIYTAENLWEDNETSVFKNAIGILTSVALIYRGLLFISRYYSDIKEVKEVNYSFIIDNPRGRRLVMDSESPLEAHLFNVGTEYVASIEEAIIIERKIKIDVDDAERKKILLGMVKDFLWYFKYPFDENHILGIIRSAIQNIDFQ